MLACCEIFSKKKNVKGPENFKSYFRSGSRIRGKLLRQLLVKSLGNLLSKSVLSLLLKVQYYVQ